MKSKNFNSFIILIMMIIYTFTTYAQTEVSGGINQSATWSVANSPYIITGNTVLFQGNTITIEPGVVVAFEDNISFKIQGNLIAIGTQEDSITFTSNLSSPEIGSWQDIFIEYVGQFVFEYVNIEFSDDGLLFGHLERASASYIKNSTFRENNMAISLNGGGNFGISIENTNFLYNNTGIGPYLENMTISNCTFLYNGFGATLIESLVENCTFSKNTVIGLDGHTSTITSSEFTQNKIGLEQSFSGGSMASNMFENVFRNNEVGLKITGNNPTATFENNSLCNNINYNVINTSSYSGQNLSSNCWCTLNEQEIEGSIFDGIEDINVGVVNFTPLFNDGLASILSDTIPICNNGLAVINAGNENLNPIYSWKFLGDESIVSNSNILETSLSGKYVLSMITDCNFVSDTITILNFQSPSAEFLFTNESCQTQTSILQYNSELVQGLTLNWNLNGGEVIENLKDSLLIVSWPSFGEKAISLETFRNGCSNSSSQIINVKKTPTSYFDVQSSICEGHSANIRYTGNGSNEASYMWDFDGGEIVSGEGMGPYEIFWNLFGSKNVSLSIIENECTSELNSVSVEYNQYPILAFENSESSCHNEPYSVKYIGGSNGDIFWDFGGATVISGSGVGPYLLDWSSTGEKNVYFSINNNGCQRDSSFQVTIAPEAIVPEICMVTVDEESSKNMLVWNYDLETIDQFGVYRETNISDQFALIDYIGGSDHVTYIDDQSSPEQVSNRYRITAIDTCGLETTFSGLHKTIHLTINKGLSNSWNLIWEGYEGFSFGTYRINRSLDEGPMELLTEVASNLSSFTDTNVPTFNVSYQIEVLNPNDCGDNSGGRSLAGSSSKSNIARASTVTSIDDLTNDLSVFPNPTVDVVHVQFNGSIIGDFSIYKLNGEELYKGILEPNTEIDLINQPNGIYLLNINTSKGRIMKKIFKQ